MIKSITIKGVASFDENGVQIADLRKVNFIYGANASGKTTISNFLSDTTDEKFIKTGCSVDWANGAELPTLVYNRGFRERNFRSNIPGIFTLGEATNEQLDLIESKKEELSKIKAAGIQKKSTIENQRKQLDATVSEFSDSCWSQIKKKYENTFDDAFVGVKSKERFKQKILDEYNTSSSATPLTYEELLKQAETIFGEMPQRLSEINYSTNERLSAIESHPVWSNKIIGKTDIDIAKLINRLNISDWVNQGRSYLQDDDICPFCQQPTITREFKKQIEDFFDETYMENINIIKGMQDEYGRIGNTMVNELSYILENQKSIANPKLDIEKFAANLKTLESMLSANREHLANKEKEPSRATTLLSTKEQFSILEGLIKHANVDIKRHNQIVDNFRKEKDNLISVIWAFIIKENKEVIEAFVKKESGLKNGIEKLEKERSELQTQYKTLDSDIKELSKHTTSIQPTIDEMNRLLKSFGFLNFEIVPANENGFYQIQREDGSLARDTLSEGEVTFITFLYFLQLAKGGFSTETVNNERILVIDDPISSLDSNILFVVSSLIKEIIKHIKKDEGIIKQIIVLTHNIYFHKEVSFIDGREWRNGNTHYWILRKQDKVSTIQAYNMDNPILSSYELLWKELKDSGAHSCSYLQNLMRRIIEHYFKVLGKFGDDDLIHKFDTKEEQDICRSLICWINEGSHSLTDDLYVELQETAIDVYKRVFKSIFVQTNNLGHYNMMMGFNDGSNEIVETND
jgi:wobble nucleotide-excising tRNase